tara:strand:- start:84 stop:464 length:381 start_codon:yes stop_codon:yes gene_type:complete
MCGLGRHGVEPAKGGTGCFLSECWDLQPDIVTFGKSIGGGAGHLLSGAILLDGASKLQAPAPHLHRTCTAPAPPTACARHALGASACACACCTCMRLRMCMCMCTACTPCLKLLLASRTPSTSYVT